MPFSFLNPWLLLGALAIAAPIWLHLRRKKETNLVQFSAVRFLEDQPQPRRSPLRLQDILLFLLRALALLLVVGAFAWPYLRGADTAPIKESRVYILDNTLSHQANDGFDKSRDRIVDEFQRLGPNFQIAVVELTSTPRVLVPFGENRESALLKLRELQPSFQRGSYLAAFRQANILLANSLGAQKRLIFLGDNQENQWNENASTPPFLRDTEIDIPVEQRPALPNLALSEPKVQRIFLGDKSLINLTVKLTHNSQAHEATVVLRANEQVIFNRPVNLKGQAETVVLQAQWESDPGAWVRGEAMVNGTPDALAADNRAFFSLAPVVEGNVALLAQSPYLRVALSPEIMRGQWAARILEPANLAGELSADRDADVLCIESTYLQSSDARKLLWRYLTNGRGVLLIMNRMTPTVAGALRELGFETEEGPVVNTGAETFQYVFSGHPIFHPFLSPDFGSLMDIKVSKYIRLKGIQAMPLVFGQRGSPLFFQGTKHPGKLFVTAFGMDREHTSWPIHQTFIPFLDLTLQAARLEDQTPTDFQPAEVSQISLPPSAGIQRVVLRDSNTEISQTPVEAGTAKIRMPEKPGLYWLTYDDKTQVEKVLAVNPSMKESVLSYANGSAALAGWKVNPDREGTSAGKGTRSNVSESLTGILQQSIWWWMVLGALLVLMLEMGLVQAKGT